MIFKSKVADKISINIRDGSKGQQGYFLLNVTVAMQVEYQMECHMLVCLIMLQPQ